MFGKRKTPPDKARQGAGATVGGDGGSSDGIIFPWQDDPAAIACNLACGSLGQSLMNWVKQPDGRVHAETYVAVAGAIAGYAAQQTVVAQGQPLNRVATKSGAEYLFGDALNAMLVPSAGVDPHGFVWSLVARSAVAAGLPQSDVPNLEAIFAHVAKSLGGPLEGRPSTGQDHQPAAPVYELLKTFWRPALNV